MDTNGQAEMRRYYWPYVLAEFLGYVLVAVFAFSYPETNFLVIMEAICVSPVFALVFRFTVFLYRVIRSWFGPIISGVGAFMGMMGILTGILKLVGVSRVSTYSIFILVTIVSIFMLFLDVKTIAKGDRTINPGIRGLVWIVSAVLLCIVIVSCAVSFFTGKYNDPKKAKKVEPVKEYLMDADYFNSPSTVISDLCEKSMVLSQQEEKRRMEDGFAIPVGSDIGGAYYLKLGDSAYSHMDGWHGVAVKNAVVIVTGYRIKTTGSYQYERAEWYVWVYPNFFTAPDGTITYETENEHKYRLTEENYEGVYEWIQKEYSDMEITELIVP